MKLSCNVTFKKITIDDENYFLQCQQNDVDDVTVRLTNGADVFSGKITKDDIRRMSELLSDMSITKLDDILLRCLTSQTNCNEFVYQLVHQDDTTFKFVMKQVLEAGIKFQVGSFEMRKMKKPATSILSFLEHLTNQLGALKKEVSDLRDGNAAMETEQKEIAKRLTKYVSAKDALEEELYTKFSMVLNEKKAKIRELKQQVESGVNLSRVQQPPIDEDIDTDEEKERTVLKKKPSFDETDKPSTSGMKRKPIDNIRLDESLEDNDDDDLPQRSRKRLRATKPKTPTNSILPRTTSIPRPKSSQASSSSQRSSRRQSSKEITSDELLDEL